MRLQYFEADYEDSGSTFGLPDQYDAGTLLNSLSGNYFLVTVNLADQGEAVGMASSRPSGVYFATVIIIDLTATGDVGGLISSMSGNYFLVVVSPPNQTDTGALASSLSGNYFLQTVAAPAQSESGAMSQSLSGVYA